jgi:hypothetical protein
LLGRARGVVKFAVLGRNCHKQALASSSSQLLVNQHRCAHARPMSA